MLVKLGCRGEPVVEVQRLLKLHGYDIDCDGIFGNGTHKTVKKFQQDNDLDVDGVVGKNTFNKLKEPKESNDNMTTMPWLEYAREEIGVHEVTNEDRVHRYWKTAKLSGLAKYPATQIPWCSGYLCAMMEKAGIRSARTDGAKNWLNWGEKLEDACDGCIVVFTRSGGGHVGIVVGEDEKGNLLVLGGNQGNAVNVKSFSRSRVTGYRYPTGYQPSYKLTEGDGTKLSDNES